MRFGTRVTLELSNIVKKYLKLFYLFRLKIDMQQVPSFTSASFPEVVFIKHEIDRRRNNNTIISCSCASLSHRFSLPSIFHFLTRKKKRVSFPHLFVIRRTLCIPYFVPAGVEQNVTAAAQGRAKHCYPRWHSTSGKLRVIS